MKNTLKLAGTMILGIVVLGCTPKASQTSPAASANATAPATAEASPEAVSPQPPTPEELAAAGFQMDGTTLVTYTGRDAHVTIPSTVTEIGKDAFFDFSFIKSVNIPSSVTTIGENAFGRTELTNVTIPSSVTMIGFGAFQEIPGLKSIDIPS